MRFFRNLPKCSEAVPAAVPHCIPRTGTLPWLVLPCALAAAFVLELSLGPVLIPFESVVSILLGHEDAPEGWRKIVLLFRLPRAVTAVLAGAALGIAGLEMQTLFRNPLADPFVLGISSGAGLGVAVVVMGASGLGLDVAIGKSGLTASASLTMAATVGAMSVMSIVLGVARRVESNVTLLIIGLMFGYISNSLVAILMQFTLEQRMHSYIAWTFGSFAGVTWKQIPLFAVTVTAGLVLARVLAKSLNGFLLGEGYARSMGVNVPRARFRIIGGASLLAGTVTAHCGPIGFLGIAIPHLCRLLLKTSDHHVLVPAVIVLGATLALMADVLSQVPGSGIVFPLNAVTSLIGAPIVVVVILNRRRAMEAGA